MLHVLRQQHPGAVAGLLTTLNQAFDRVAMHAVRRQLLEAQAAAAGLPLRAVDLPWPCSNAEYEERMGHAVRALVNDGFTHVAFGDLFLEDVRQYREDRLAGTGLTPLFPLWKTKSTAALAAEMLARRAARLSDVRRSAKAGSHVCGSSLRRVARRRPARHVRSVRRKRRIPLVRLRGADVLSADSSARWRRGGQGRIHFRRSGFRRRIAEKHPQISQITQIWLDRASADLVITCGRLDGSE